MLGIQPGPSGSGSKYAKYFAIRPDCRLNLFGRRELSSNKENSNFYLGYKLRLSSVGIACVLCMCWVVILGQIRPVEMHSSLTFEAH